MIPPKQTDPERSVASQWNELENPLESAISLAAAPADGSPNHEHLQRFRGGLLSTGEALSLWLGRFRDHIEEQGFESWKAGASLRLAQSVAEIDQLISDQLNAVLHHPRFQRLEASWRGLQMLVDAVAAERLRGSTNIMIRMLNVSWREIHRDFERAIEFDSSQLFKKIYEDEFGTAGGIPFGVMIGDYEIHPRPTPDHPFDDMSILGNLAGVAAAAFCPFVCGASPTMFGVDQFSELEHTKDLARGFDLTEFVRWRSLRRTEDARFLGLALPRVLLRAPYSQDATEGFCFSEDSSGRTTERYLWGNAAFAWATVLIRTFADCGWLADIRGTDRNREGGGLVTSLPSIGFGTDRPGVASRISTDLVVTDRQESELARLGFLPLCHCYDTPYSAFYSSQSVQEPAKYDDPEATANANLSSMLQYILCVSRFAHYLKVLARDEIGSVTEPSDLQDRLDRWIKQYVTPDQNAKLESKAKRPLRQAEVSVTRDPEKPGTYQLVFRLLPHYQLDDLSVSIRLQTTEIKREVS
jgi:type VI secretion system ImpC/EvpB family protein